jgi:Na+/proline symporter
VVLVTDFFLGTVGFSVSVSVLSVGILAVVLSAFSVCFVHDSWGYGYVVVCWCWVSVTSIVTSISAIPTVTWKDTSQGGGDEKGQQNEGIHCLSLVGF